MQNSNNAAASSAAENNATLASNSLPPLPSLEELKQQRASTKGRITRIKNIVENNKTLSSTELECRLGMLDAYYKQVSYYQNQIERYCPIDSARSDIDELYVSTNCLILSLVDGRGRQSYHEQTFSLPQLPSNRLPHLKLPKFDGKYLEFKNFIHIFQNLVDSDSLLTSIEKFNHLLSCLQGEALATVKAFQITEDNYPKALQRLKERYDNDPLIFLEGIVTLFDEPQCIMPDSTQLRQLVDNISALYSSLKSLGSHEQICDAIMIHLVMTKADSETKRKWNECHDYTKLPTWLECCKMSSILMSSILQHYQQLSTINGTSKGQAKGYNQPRVAAY
ncbi:uncharacterized protein LOC119665651 [Teleopsis dalmanni]|uniref:uncharacterized protein LOC119665651 n=1 Tax=Teleopsis dalmanni TaxID=139649 RepID=UPI0018CFE71F|nr:uncharacterized protein LOC119665651 [Teleopsis dalmanni]